MQLAAGSQPAGCSADSAPLLSHGVQVSLHRPLPDPVTVFPLTLRAYRTAMTHSLQANRPLKDFRHVWLSFHPRLSVPIAKTPLTARRHFAYKQGRRQTALQAVPFLWRLCAPVVTVCDSPKTATLEGSPVRPLRCSTPVGNMRFAPVCAYPLDSTFKSGGIIRRSTRQCGHKTNRSTGSCTTLPAGCKGDTHRRLSGRQQHIAMLHLTAPGCA